MASPGLVYRPGGVYIFNATADKLAQTFTANDLGTPVIDLESGTLSHVVAGGSGYTCVSHGKTVVTGWKISSKAADAEVGRFVAPVTGKLLAIRTTLNGALATGDGTVTVAINGTGVTTGIVTLTQSGSAAGDVASAIPTALNAVTAGDKVTATVGGASTATATFNIELIFQEG